MRNPLRRYYGQGHLHFVTVSCYRRLPLLGTQYSRDLFVKTLGDIRSQYEFQLVGYVVMPEHVHLLISEPQKGNPSKALQVLKQKTSRTLGRRRERSSTDSETNAQAFWQRRFYDFNVWSAKKITQKLEYMHANPVVRGLVEHPKDWRWSSWSFYGRGEQGMIPIDGLG
jgi:putative transposase